ncbi:MAG: hypothetical protein ACR2L2_09100 [Acidobacteriota bacterium]
MKRIFLALTAGWLCCGVGLAGEVVFPHLVSGPRYIAELKIANLGDVPATVTLSFFTPQGETTDAFADTPALVVSGRSTELLRLKRGGQDLAGWARATSTALIGGSLSISYLPTPGVVSSVSFDNLDLVSTARISAGGETARRTAMAVCNPSAAPLMLDVEVLGARGEMVGKLSWTLPPHGQRALFLDELGLAGASVELISRSGLFAAVSVAQNASEMVGNPVIEVLDRRLVLEHEQIDLGFAPYEVGVQDNIAVVTGSNGVNIINLKQRALLSTIPVPAIRTLSFGRRIAFHRLKPLVAVAGAAEIIVVDTTTLAVIRRFPQTSASIAFDDSTDTLVLVTQFNAGAGPPATRLQALGENFNLVATRTLRSGSNVGRPDVRNGKVVLAGGGASFATSTVPSLEGPLYWTLPAGSSANREHFSSDNVIAFGPEASAVGNGSKLLTLYYLDSGRSDQIFVGEQIDTKTVGGGRVYLTRQNKLRIVDLLQRKIIHSSILSFTPKDMGFSAELDTLVLLDSSALHLLKLDLR